MIILSNKSDDRETNLRYMEFTTDNFSKDILMKLIKESDEFNKLMLSGNYFFYQNKLWLCLKDVIDLDDNQVVISKKALSNQKEYCLFRSYKLPIYSNSQIGIKRKDVTRSMFPKSMRPYLVGIGRFHSTRKRHRHRSLVPQPHTTGRLGLEKTEKLEKTVNKITNSLLHPQSWALNENINIVLASQFFNAKRVTDCQENNNQFFNEISEKMLMFTRGKSTGGGGDGGDNDKRDYLMHLAQAQSFGDLFTYLMKRNKYTIKKLSEDTGISDKTISRMRTNSNTPTLDYIVICCVVMELMPWESVRLIQLAGYFLRKEFQKERCYIACIYVLYIYGDLNMCDKLFEKNGFEPLTSALACQEEE